MKVGILGTGAVGIAIATKLVELGHEVTMGARDNKNANAEAWAAKMGDAAHSSDFAGAAAFGDILWNCTAGMHSIEALVSAGRNNLDGKILIDVSNPIDMTNGEPVRLAVCNSDSLAEQIQRTFPETKVVKTLNTVTAAIMVEPSLLRDGATVYLSGDSDQAKLLVTQILNAFGWKTEDIIDLGAIVTARGPEMMMPLWLGLWHKLGTANFALKIAL